VGAESCERLRLQAGPGANRKSTFFFCFAVSLPQRIAVLFCAANAPTKRPLRLDPDSMRAKMKKKQGVCPRNSLEKREEQKFSISRLFRHFFAPTIRRR
jgi:hypothetical protein